MAGQRPAPPWVQAEVVTLLAWIDFCREGETDFDSTVLAKLQTVRDKTCSGEFKISMIRVKDKIWTFLKHPATKGTMNPTEVLVKGTSCLHGISSEIREEANVALEQCRIATRGRDLSTSKSSDAAGGQTLPTPLPPRTQGPSMAESSNKQPMTEAGAVGFQRASLWILG